ncbi:MAG: terminase gpA endonuclease subunit, partial [Methylocella sp.]
MREAAWCIGTCNGFFLTADADVQKDRIEVSIWAWDRGLTSWLIEHIVIEGGQERQASWDELTSLLGRTWPHAHGARLGIAKLAVDTGYQASFIHLSQGAEAEWIKQLLAEQLVTVTTRRVQKLEWQKLRERNEVLDCRVYARAAAWIAGADRWSGAKWRGLEDQLGPAPGQTDGHRV